jgi:hypothetical protein
LPGGIERIDDLHADQLAEAVVLDRALAVDQRELVEHDQECLQLRPRQTAKLRERKLRQRQTLQRMQLGHAAAEFLAAAAHGGVEIFFDEGQLLRAMIRIVVQREREDELHGARRHVRGDAQAFRNRGADGAGVGDVVLRQHGAALRDLRGVELELRRRARQRTGGGFRGARRRHRCGGCEA